MIQEINQPVEVIAVFNHGSIQPRRIRWGGRVYHVTKLVHTWRQKVGREYQTHIAVETDAYTAMELVVDPSDMSWRLATISLEG